MGQPYVGTSKTKPYAGTSKVKAIYRGTSKIWNSLDGIIFVMYKLYASNAPYVWAINADDGSVEYTIPMKTTSRNFRLFYTNNMLFHAEGANYYSLEFEYSTDDKNFTLSTGFAALYRVIFSNNKWYYVGNKTYNYDRYEIFKSDTFLGASTGIATMQDFSKSVAHFFEYKGVPYLKNTVYIYRAEDVYPALYDADLSYGGATVTDENNVAILLSTPRVKIIRNFPTTPEDSTYITITSYSITRLVAGNGLLVTFNTSEKKFIIINSKTYQVTYVDFPIHVDNICFSKKAGKFFFVTGESASTALFMTTNFINNVEVLRGYEGGAGTFTMCSNDNL